MKNMYFIPIISLALAACTASVDNVPLGPTHPQKTYSDSQLSGNIFGKSWAAKTAILKPFGPSKDQLSLSIYQDISGDACKSPHTATPHVSIVLPAQYEVKEYNFDLYSGTPLVFSESSNNGKNLIADTTFLKINKITDSGFIASLISSGVDEDGTRSEINGTIEVLDCSKQISFTEWESLEGWYRIFEFNGKATTDFSTTLEVNKREFYNKATKSYVKTLIIPLYASVGSNTTSEYLFGPMEGLGKSTVQEVSNGKKMTYTYNGPISYQGIDITLNLNLSITTTPNDMTIWYELEVPNHITKKSHTFKVKK